MKIKIHFMLKFILSFIMQILAVVNCVVPKNDKRIMFFNRKETYMNNYALFKFLNEENYNFEYHITYVMPNISNYTSDISNLSVIELRRKTDYIKTVLCFFRCKYIFYDNSNLRIKPCKNQKIINLWHGTPLKKIGFMSNSATMLTKNALNCYTEILLSNEIQDSIYINSFNIKKEQILHIGYPRNDLMFRKSSSFSDIIENYNNFDKHIIWMTTYRVTNDGVSHTTNKDWSHTGIPLIVDEEALENINSSLQQNNTLLIIKMHQNNSQNNMAEIKYSNIFYLSEEKFLIKNMQMYELLSCTDALITDYSSIYFDYLLLNKPIGFILDDIEIYKEKNGLYYDDIDKYLPGEHIYCLNDLKNFISNLIAEIDNKDKDRSDINRLFNKYDKRGGNSEELLKYLEIIKNEGVLE